MLNNPLKLIKAELLKYLLPSNSNTIMALRCKSFSDLGRLSIVSAHV